MQSSGKPSYAVVLLSRIIIRYHNLYHDIDDDDVDDDIMTIIYMSTQTFSFPAPCQSIEFQHIRYTISKSISDDDIVTAIGYQPI